MRPRQWVKNGVVLVPLFFDRKVFEIPALPNALLGFALFCLMSSTVYLINDLSDIEADRAHPSKRNRPLPSGELRKELALLAAVILPLVTLPLAFWLSIPFGTVLAGYLALQLAYSLRLKHIVMLDVLAVAAGFVLRVAGGVILVDVVRFSPWLYLFTTMLALFLAIAKRRQELILLANGAGSHRSILDEYTVSLLDELLMIVSTSTIITYAFYSFSAEGLPANHSMMLTIPFVIYGVFHYLYLIHVKGETAPPDELLLRDRRLQITVALFVLAAFIVLYGFPA